MSRSVKSSVISPRLAMLPAEERPVPSGGALLISTGGVAMGVPTGPSMRCELTAVLRASGGSGSSPGCASTGRFSHPAIASISRASTGETARSVQFFTVDLPWYGRRKAIPPLPEKQAAHLSPGWTP